MFDDLLELSRPGLYPQTLRIHAIQLIMAQIASNNTYHLQCSFAKWEIDHDELVTFLSEIIGVVLFSKRGFANGKLVDAYMTALPHDCHPWLPCIRFLGKIAQLNGGMFHGVLATRFLEMILWVSGSQRQGMTTSPLEDACSKAFTILSAPPSHALSILWVEYVLELCSNHPVTSLLKMRSYITCQNLWPVVEGRLLAMHADAMLKMIVEHDLFQKPGQSKYGDNMSGRKYGDYLIWPRFPILLSQPIFSVRFARNFLRCVGFGGDVRNQTISRLSCLSHRKRVKILALVITHLVLQSHEERPEVESSILLFTPKTPDIAKNVVQFLIDISTALKSIENPVLDAALLTILPFIETRWHPDSILEDIYRRMYPPFHRLGTPLPLYRAQTLELLTNIRSAGLCGVVQEETRSRGWVDFLQPLFQSYVTQ
ncbi:hypothetical protein K438DRAFT_1836852 [Mycena galopus ATCC 62051]|nr:hypothetical protein K438DRAFT_1836852 [Mycena galopus ATCC 62051]